MGKTTKDDRDYLRDEAETTRLNMQTMEAPGEIVEVLIHDVDRLAALEDGIRALATGKEGAAKVARDSGDEDTALRAERDAGYLRGLLREDLVANYHVHQFADGLGLYVYRGEDVPEGSKETVETQPDPEPQATDKVRHDAAMEKPHVHEAVDRVMKSLARLQVRAELVENAHDGDLGASQEDAGEVRQALRARQQSRVPGTVEYAARNLIQESREDVGSPEALDDLEWELDRFKRHGEG